MSHLFLAKQLDGYAATFVRFTGADNFVIEVNGEERTVTREFWCSLSEMKAEERSAGHHSLQYGWQRGVGFYEADPDERSAEARDRESDR